MVQIAENDYVLNYSKLISVQITKNIVWIMENDLGLKLQKMN